MSTPTAFHRWRRAPRRLSLVLVAGGALAAACKPQICTPDEKVPTCAAPTGMATVKGPGEFELESEARVTEANSCLAANGSCTSDASFVLVAYRHPEGALRVKVYIPNEVGPQTYTLPAGAGGSVAVDARVFGSNQEQFQQLRVLSGAISLERADRSGFRARANMELEHPDHRHFSVTEGSAEITGCRVVTIPGECHYDAH